MSTTTTTAPAALVIRHIPTAPEGIVRLFVPEGFEVSKGDLRNAAAKVAGTINVGRTPAGKGATLKGVKGTGYDFAPVARTTAAAKAAPAAPAAVPDTDPRVVALTALGLTPEQIAAALAVTPAAPAAKAGKAAKAKAAKAPREVPAFLRKWENVTCRTCRDFGKVHGPTAGEKAGKAFRTQRGADTAPTGVACPTHVTAAA